MLNIHVRLPSRCLTTPSDSLPLYAGLLAPRAMAARLWRKQGSPVRAPDRAVFDNSPPTTRAWRQPASACRSGSRQGSCVHFPAAGLPGWSRSLVRTCIGDWKRAGAVFLSSPPLFFRWQGKCSFPRGFSRFCRFSRIIFWRVGSWKASKSPQLRFFLLRRRT